MEMLKLDAYSGAQLQAAISIVQQCADAGVDITTAIKLLKKQVQAMRMAPTPVAQERQRTLCQCGARLSGPYKIDGIFILSCSKKCGYSEVVG